MAANETKNYEMLYDQIKEEIEKAAIAIKDTKGTFYFSPQAWAIESLACRHWNTVVYRNLPCKRDSFALETASILYNIIGKLLFHDST